MEERKKRTIGFKSKVTHVTLSKLTLCMSEYVVTLTLWRFLGLQGVRNWEGFLRHSQWYIDLREIKQSVTLHYSHYADWALVLKSSSASSTSARDCTGTLLSSFSRIDVGEALWNLELPRSPPHAVSGFTSILSAVTDSCSIPSCVLPLI